MSIKNKKELAARTFNVSKSRIVFVPTRIEEIQEAITKQDIRDLVSEGAIKILPIKGRISTRKKPSRSMGNVRKKINLRKEKYVKLTRKLRKHVKHLKEQGNITLEEFKSLRKKIRNKAFRSKEHLKEQIMEMKK